MNEAVEEYLEALYTLEEEGRSAKTTDIAALLSIAPASVTEMLKRLQGEGYVSYRPYYGAELTQKGRRVAKRIKRKHRILERFLAETLNLDVETVHDQACKMEHSLSDEAEESLCRLLNHPDTCPDDHKPIPVCDKNVSSCVECIDGGDVDPEEEAPRERDLTPLIALREGTTASIAFVRGGRNVVQRLTDMGLTPKTTVRVLCSAPFGGPIKLSVRGSELCIGRGIAEKIFVEGERA